MKKSLTGAVMLLAGAFVAHSQGTVAFGNYTGSGTDQASYMYVSLANGTTTKIGGGSTGPAPTTSNWAAEVGNGDDWTVGLYGASGLNQPGATPATAGTSGSLLPLTDTAFVTPTPLTAPLADGNFSAVAGTWYSGDAGAVPGAFNGSPATVQAFAWYNAGGTITTYAAAFAAGVPTGFSSTANVTALGGPFSGNSAPPGLPANLPNLGNFNVSTVPEPSTIALGMMGASAFLLRLRKKQ